MIPAIFPLLGIYIPTPISIIHNPDKVIIKENVPSYAEIKHKSLINITHLHTINKLWLWINNLVIVRRVSITISWDGQAQYSVLGIHPNIIYHKLQNGNALQSKYGWFVINGISVNIFVEKENTGALMLQ